MFHSWWTSIQRCQTTSFNLQIWEISKWFTMLVHPLSLVMVIPIKSLIETINVIFLKYKYMLNPYMLKLII